MFHQLAWLISCTILAMTLQGGSASPPDETPFPIPGSIKGLQVQMTDDAIKLGIKHAAINVNLCQLLALPTQESSGLLVHQHTGSTCAINPSYVEHLDQQIKPLSDQGIVVYLILLAYPDRDPAKNSLLIHPNAHASGASYQVGGFNTETTEGISTYRTLISFLASRYSSRDTTHGRVWGYIIGNEVNSQFSWYHLGEMTLPNAVKAYHQAVRLAHDVIREHSRHARVFLSFDHHWNIAMPGSSDKQAYPARAFLDSFARLSEQQGDFEWHVAHHPYPDDLGNPRTWLDQLAHPTDETPHITFRNLQVAEAYMKKPHLLWNNLPRRIILSEQGIHCLSTPDGEKLQAAGFAYAWEKVKRCKGIDALIWHRHVDHAHEGGLRLGLWENKPDSIATPHRPRLIYELFQKADRPEWPAVTEFALPIIGVPNWAELP